MIDQGGHATRAIVFDRYGALVYVAESPIKTIAHGLLAVEHDPVELLQSVTMVIDDVACFLGDDVSKIKQAGLATQRSSIVCWNKKTGKALSPIISWQDRRTVNDIEKYKKHAKYIHETTGLYLNPHYGATKMRWCLDNLSVVQREREANNLCIAPMASFILFHLLENKPFLIDPANASRSLLMNYKKLSWQTELLDIFSIPKEVLPEIVPTKKIHGAFFIKSPEAEHSIPLVICTGDQSAAIYSQGQLLRDEVFVNAGTGAFVLRPAEGVPDLRAEKILASVVYADEKNVSYVTEGTVNGAGRALQWLGEKTNITGYECHLDEWCAGIQAPPVFINAISGVGSPYWLAELDSYFIGEGSVHAKFVSVLESIVFLVLENVKAIIRVSGNIKQLRVAGGISRNRSFCQKVANLLKLNVVLAQEAEATGKGVYYLLAGRAAGRQSDRPEIFRPKTDQSLHERYKCWQKVMAQHID